MAMLEILAFIIVSIGNSCSH